MRRLPHSRVACELHHVRHLPGLLRVTASRGALAVTTSNQISLQITKTSTLDVPGSYQAKAILINTSYWGLTGNQELDPGSMLQGPGLSIISFYCLLGILFLLLTRASPLAARLSVRMLLAAYRIGNYKHSWSGDTNVEPRTKENAC